MMKKIVLFVLTVLLSARLFALDFSLKLLPAYEFSTEKLFNKAGGFSVGLGADIAPVTFRERDKLYITAQFTSTNFSVKDFGLQSLVDGVFGVGYTVRIMDRFGVTQVPKLLVLLLLVVFFLVVRFMQIIILHLL